MSATDPSDIFRQEAQELLEELEQTLLDLARSPGDDELIDGAFRALHTIKGSGSMFGFERVAAFTHHVATAFDLLRKGQIAPNADLVAVALSAKDHLRNLIEQPSHTGDEQGAAILENLGKAMAAAGGTPMTQSKPSGWRIAMRLPKNAMSMGTNPLLLLDELRTLGEATIMARTDAIPALDEIDPTECHVGWDIVLRTDKPRSAIEEVFLFVLDDMDLKIEPLDDEEPAAATAVAGQSANSGDPQIERGEPGAKNAASIRVPAERLDELMDRVGELVIAQSRLKQLAATSDDGQVKAIAEEIERLALELRDTTMGVRMVPIASLFGRFRRLVHDLAGELGKEIVLSTAGEDTELDKTVIERLADPLIHLIRNAIDHGLEPPEARTAKGKPRQGRIRLSARHTGDKVLISITDDGHGLDRGRIRARAEEQGLIPSGATLSDTELLQLIFQPGFSTASQVTNLSGRGVGMDVVKRTIDALRGSIDVASEPGRGAEITLRLPLTLAIIDGLLVRVGQGRYVIPLSAVEECVELSAAEDARSKGRSFMNIRGDLVPFLRLREIFRTMVPADPYQKVVIVSSGEARVGLVVDQVIGDHQTVIKSLSKLHADVGTFSGATILGDGSVALILEVAHLVADGQARDDRLKAAG